MAHPNQQQTASSPPAANTPPLSYPPAANNPVYPPVGNNIDNYMHAATTSIGSNYIDGHPSNGSPAYATSMVAVIGPQFCSPNPMDLIITRKVSKVTEGNFTIEDVNGNVMFKIKDGIDQLLRDRRVLRDAQGKAIVTLREKMMSAHNRWHAFRGDSKNPKDLLFSAKESSLLKLKTNLDVFLASNGHEGIYDFKVKGSWLERSCVFYGGNSKVIIAQMHKKLSTGSVVTGKDKFMVTVYPNVDCAFIVALIVLLDAIYHEIQLTKFDIV